MSIIYVNDPIILKNDNNNISILEKLEIKTEDIITSSINIKDVITYTFKLPKSTPQDQLKMEAEIYFFENAGIDPNKQFKTFFITRELKEEEAYLIEAIAIDQEQLHTKFEDLVSKTKYIDFISFSVFAFEEFYELYKKEKKRDAFVYLDNNQSFVAVYENGEYLYSKILNPLSSLLKTLKIEYDEFTEIISSKGLIKEEYELDEFLVANEIEKFFSEYFTAINNRLSYGKNIFYLENIDNLYFYTPFTIKGIDTLKTFWDLSGVNFELIPIEEINFLDKLTLLYNSNHYKDEINFSIFPRPPKFYKTKTFQLVSVIIATILIFGGDFGYRYYQNQQISQNIKKIESQIKTKTKKLQKLQFINKQILEKLNKYNTEITNIETKLKLIKNILEKALIITYLPKTSDDFILFSKLLQKNNLKAFVLSKDNTQSYIVGIYTKPSNRKFITLFIKDLLKHNYTNIKTDKISTINNNNYYISLIRFEK